MKIIRFSVVSLLLALTFFVTSYCVATASEPPKNVPLLFVQVAQKAVLKEGQSGAYKLILSQVDPNITYFADRPARAAGTLTLKEFVKKWESKDHNSFSNVNPNGNISGVIISAQVKDKMINIPVKLSDIAYSETFKTLSYTIVPLSKDQQLAAISPSELQYVSVFIDDIDWSSF